MTTHRGSDIIIDDEFLKFKERFQMVDKKAPSKIYVGLDKFGNKLKREIVAITPSSNITKPPKKKLKNKWSKEEAKKDIDGYNKKIYSTAPHFHLVERGHKAVARRATVKGDTKGRQYRVKASSGKKFVDGRYFFDKFMNSKEDDIDKAFEKIIDDIFENILE